MSTPCGACLSSLLYLSLLLFVTNYLIIVFIRDDVSVELAINRDSLDWSEERHKIQIAEDKFYAWVGLWHPEQSTFLKDGVLTFHAELEYQNPETDEDYILPLDVFPCTRERLEPPGLQIHEMPALPLVPRCCAMCRPVRRVFRGRFSRVVACRAHASQGAASSRSAGGSTR